MCFSAEASFVASGILTVMGILTIREALGTKRPFGYMPMAIVPLLFGLQQGAEGVNWLYLQGVPWAAALSPYSILFFCVCAVVVWPLLVPISQLILSKTSRQIALNSLAFLCGVIAVTISVQYLLVAPVVTQTHCHLFYSAQQAYVANPFTKFFYILAALMPPLSGIVPIGYGFAWLGSCLLAFLISYQCAFSVWCFFAAIVSVGIFFVLRDFRKCGA